MSKNLARWACGVATVLLLNSPLLAGTADFPQYGFQIDTLDSTVGSSPAQAVMMFLPVSDGFAPNVNVQIQPFSGSLKDYAALSKKQFDEMKFKLVSEQQKSDSEWVVEYSGAMQSLQLHWYARALLSNQKVYLVTATARDSQWAKIADQLKKNVESFKLKP
jgi:hypothetical protein